MKLSLAWIFDHIDADWQKSNPEKIMELFNKTTAEVESFYTVAHDLTTFFMAKPDEAEEQKQAKPDEAPSLMRERRRVIIPELQQTISLPLRPSSATEIAGCWLVKKEGSNFRWATLADFGVEKEGVLQSFAVTEQQLTGSWREQWQDTDVILEVDNKSITHRPDMWGHRGFAREIAAFMKLPLRPVSHFLKPIPTLPFHRATSKQTATCPIVIDNQDVDGCSRYAGLYFSAAQNSASDIRMASRLMNIGSRSINALVDLTNYVMNDWSQPMHTYDADKIQGSTVVIRKAHAEEPFRVLGDVDLTLTPDDMIIADAQQPMCLAGIKGGANSGVSSATTKIWLEAATFDAGVVRRTAQRHKLRTDSSARFEKTLNPEQTIEAIQRFAHLLDVIGIKATAAQEIVWVGAENKIQTIEVSHAFLESRMGISLTDTEIINLLTPLEFHVLKSKNQAGETVYLVTIPAFRASKDIKIKEDILEEIVRTYGFDRIPLIFPKITRLPFSMQATMRVRTIKRFFAQAASMIEQQNYSLFDEQFIASLGLKLLEVVHLINPISENHFRMITSLVPGLFKNIKENHVHHEALSFFEWGRVWKGQGDKVETKSLAGIIFKKREDVDFYAGKALITHMFHALGLDENKLVWAKPVGSQDQWYAQYQTAQILYDGKVIGTAGMADPVIMNKLSVDAPCTAFIFELDGSFLISAPARIPAYSQISKFQDTYVDISLFAPLNLATQSVIEKLRTVDELVKRVDLIDFFEKEEWQDVRAVTVRLWLEHPEKTLQKVEIDAVWQLATTAVAALGAKVRT